MGHETREAATVCADVAKVSTSWCRRAFVMQALGALEFPRSAAQLHYTGLGGRPITLLPKPNRRCFMTTIGLKMTCTELTFVAVLTALIALAVIV